MEDYEFRVGVGFRVEAPERGLSCRTSVRDEHDRKVGLVDERIMELCVFLFGVCWLKEPNCRVTLRLHVPKQYIVWPQSFYIGTTLKP